MTHFMAYVVLLSAGISACAVVAELVLRSRVSGTRWVWLTALSAILLAAVIATVAPPPVEIAPSIIPSRPLIVDGITAPPVTVTVERVDSRSIVEIADSVLPVAWVVASVLLLFAILLGQRSLTIARRSAAPRSVNGHDVLLTEDLGPAVAGFGRPVVFLPRWVLALDPQAQQLLLAHEFEHAKRGDTRLLLAAAVAAAIMPWNPVVWWITRRMRLAVEQDCDARVLRTHPDVRRYADLLLTAASRPGVYAHLLAAHFGEHRSDLDRRIQAMTDKTLKWRPLVAVAAVAAGLIVASCEAPPPEPLAPRQKQPTAVTTTAAEDVVYLEHQVEKPVKLEAGTSSPRYPDILRQAGVEGEALVSFVVDEEGNADPASFKVIRSTHELFAIAVKKALPDMGFAAARIGGKTVKQLVIQPFSFSLPGIEAKVTEVKKLANAVNRNGVTTGSWEPKAGPTIVLRSDRNRVGAPGQAVNVELLTQSGELLSRNSTDGIPNELNPEDIQSIEVFKPAKCPAASTCPLIRITLKTGREAVYKKQR